MNKTYEDCSKCKRASLVIVLLFVVQCLACCVHFHIFIVYYSVNKVSTLSPFVISKYLYLCFQNAKSPHTSRSAG